LEPACGLRCHFPFVEMTDRLSLSVRSIEPYDGVGPIESGLAALFPSFALSCAFPELSLSLSSAQNSYQVFSLNFFALLCPRSMLALDALRIVFVNGWAGLALHSLHQPSTPFLVPAATLSVTHVLKRPCWGRW